MKSPRFAAAWLGLTLAVPSLFAATAAPADNTTARVLPIAERAYAIYIERGCADGLDREDWLRAELELKAAPSIAPGKDSTMGRKRAKRR